MEGDPQSPYHHRDRYRDQIAYSEDTHRGVSDRPRPASARDLSYGDMYDSGIHAHSSSPRINQIAYSENPGPLGLDGRSGSLDRRGELYGTLRGNFDTASDKLTKSTGRQQYTLKSLNSNPGLSAVLGSGGQTGRRAHSYDMDLEKQGLADYNSLLAAAGVGTNPNIYGNPTTQLLDYSGLTAPTLSSLGGLDYASLQRAAYPTIQPALLNFAAASDITTLQRECLRLQHELDITREKLNACTTSIRTFWSPELKRERSMRKEENAKYAILADHLHQLQLEKQTMLETLHNMEEDLRRERDIRIRGRFSSEHGREHLSELDLAKRQVDELTLENKQLKKAVEEADRRTSNVKASLTATEESLRRLIEAVKAGKAATAAGVPTSETGGSTGVAAAAAAVDASGASNIRLERIESDRAEISRLRHQLNEACTRGSDAERQLVDRNFEFSRLKEEFAALLQDHRQLKQENDSLRQDVRQTQTLQSIVDTKESKIMTLENEIRLLEDEITRLRDDGLITPNTSTSSGIDDLDKTLQTFRSNERLLKSKIEMLNGEISKRDCEIYTLQSRLEMTDKQHQDQTHHINVLKEQVKTREHKIAMLTADTEDFRKRLKEKETQLEKKTKALANAQTSKRQLETELTELKDQLDIKERKISLLQRKIENLEDLLNDKDTQLAASKARLTRISSERAGVEGVRAAIEESLKEREVLSERLKEARTRGESPGLDEIDAQKRIVAELRSRLELVQREADEKASKLLELREELGELRTGRYKHESEVSQLQSQLNQQASEMATLQIEKQMQHKQISSEYELKYSQRITELESQVNHYVENNSKLQSEIDRLIRTLDNEKYEREKQMHEMQEELRESQNNLSSLKRSQQTERKKQTQLLEEARQREDNAHSDVEILKGIMSEKDSRIRELEQALRESVRLTAEREIYASGRDDETRHLEQQLREMRTNLEQLQRERNNLSAQLATVQEELSDRENQLKTLEQECFQNYLPELEKLRRANHEANMRVAAMVKLTQGREHTLTDQDRAALSGIPLFPNLASSGGWSVTGVGGPTSSRLLTGSGGYLGAYHSGGTTSPHLAGSAFQLIGNSSSALAAAAGGRASVPGQPIPSPDVVMLTRMLQDKENTIQQHLHELTHLRFQNSELEIRLKATQRELEAKSTRLSILEAAQYSALSRIEASGPSPTGLSNEITQLRKANQDLSVKLAQLQMDLDDRERQLRAMDRLQSTTRSTTDFSEMAMLRRELVTVKAEKETEILSLNSQLEKTKAERDETNNKLKEVTSALAEKSNQLRLTEAEKDKELMDREALQKKYEVVLTQLGDKTDKVQYMENEMSKQAEEVRRQKAELDDMRHHSTYLQNTIQERENRIEAVEKESSKLRDELVSLKKQLSNLETEVKGLQEELAYREERLRQLQTQHTDEMSRLRSANQEQATRNSHLEMKLDEKEHELKTQSSELRRHSDEIARLQASIEEYTNRLAVSQKRVEERELRLKKLENENHDLLDEIHGLRKGNTDLESQVDSLRQRLLDRQDRPGSVGPSAAMSPPIRTHQSVYGPSSTTMNQELERVRKQYSETKSLQEQTQKALEDAQIQYDQMTVQRNTLRTQLEQEIAKRAMLEEKLRASDDQWKVRVSQAENSEQSRQATLQLNELRNELERKEAQITCLNKELERVQTSSALRDRLPDATNQQLLLADLQVRLRQVTEERDQAKDQLAAAVSHTESTYLETQQQLLLEKQTLHQQVANLTQTAQNATSEADRYQREARQASARVQQLSRQLQETQNNCDSIARQRDSLRDQLDQLKRTPGRSGSSALSSVANLFGTGGGTSYSARPASAGPGSYETFGGYGTMGSTSQLSRELDRLHREHELTLQQLRTTQEAEEMSRNEMNRIKQELEQMKQEVEQQKVRLKELEQQKQSLESEMVRIQREESDKAQQQQRELREKLQWTEQQLNEKTSHVENLSHQLNNTRQYCGELEQNVNQITQRLNTAESRTQSQLNDLQQYQQLQTEYSVLRNEIQGKNSEIQRLTIQLDQVNREYQNQQHQLEQMTIELSTTQANLTQVKREAQQWQQQQQQQQQAITMGASRPGTDNATRETGRETIQLLQTEIIEAAHNRQEMEKHLDELQNELCATRNELDEKTRLLRSLEENQLKQQNEMIASLQRELQVARAQVEELGGSTGQGASGKASPLKIEIDSLKRELTKREDTIARLEKECVSLTLSYVNSLKLLWTMFELF
ncbi:ELKS/Rab6-interacting/CAST family member 1 [Fasciola gigantica]|uniref:ELKS/Rab6-interacting/CAST family member 1 n=1 Tax=Fasciola gigantica TaxID=46835 RepID=A0A504XBC4_FASGI|nr:ELKS/Rab6-interacting/CAST family member 1 [Fasciola gigantica]